MRILVTGSSGHLGEALVRVLRPEHDVVGLDLLLSPHTDVVGSVTDGEPLRSAMAGADAVLHTATLHKPHVGTHGRSAFVQTNVAGTLAVLEQAMAAGVGRVVMTSTTSAYGRALTRPGAATWIDEDVRPLPRNVYGVTKAAAEDLCELVARDTGLPVVVLRTSRFFPEGDDRDDVRAAYSTENAQVNELLSRRVDLEDVVTAHVCALERAPQLGFGRYVVSATTPFTRDDLAELLVDAPAVVRRRVPGTAEHYARLGWRMFPLVDRVYDAARARAELGWAPRWDHAYALEQLAAGWPPRSELAQLVGAKGYHDVSTGPYTSR